MLPSVHDRSFEMDSRREVGPPAAAQTPCARINSGAVDCCEGRERGVDRVAPAPVAFAEPRCQRGPVRSSRAYRPPSRRAARLARARGRRAKSRRTARRSRPVPTNPLAPSRDTAVPRAALRHAPVLPRPFHHKGPGTRAQAKQAASRRRSKRSAWLGFYPSPYKLLRTTRRRLKCGRSRPPREPRLGGAEASPIEEPRRTGASPRPPRGKAPRASARPHVSGRRAS